MWVGRFAAGGELHEVVPGTGVYGGGFMGDGL